MVRTNNYEYIYYFALYVENAPIKELAEAEMAIGNAQYIYEFARDVNNAPIRELAEAEMKTGNLHYISVFARNVKGASVYIDEFKMSGKYITSISPLKLDISTLTDEEMLKYLIVLYKRDDFEEIRRNKELFSALFQDEEEIKRK